MKGGMHRGMMLAAAAAGILAAPGAMAPSMQAQAQTRVLGGGGSMQMPQGGIGTMLGSMLQHSGGGVGGGWKPRYRKYDGYSCAEGKRRKERRRNKLRSKGQHRKAVR